MRDVRERDDMRGRQGFTLIELILSLLITAMIALTLAPLFRISVDNYRLTTTTTTAMNDARFALSQISRELTLLRAGDIIALGASNFQFTDRAGAATSYQLVGSTALRGNALLANNINSLTFTYYDANRTVTNVVANVRRIMVSLQIAAPGTGNFTMQTEIFPRSFAYTNFQ